jgi:Lon protease-like protein
MDSAGDSLVLPIFPLECTLLPGEPQALRIFEPRYKQMLDDCLLDDLPFGICLVDPFHPVNGWTGPHLIGTTARICGHEEAGSNHIIEIQGQRRFRIIEIIEPAAPPMDAIQHRVFPDLESLMEMVGGDDDARLYIRAKVEWMMEPEGTLDDDFKAELEDMWMAFLSNLAKRNSMPEEMVEEWKGAQLATVSDWDSSSVWRIASVLVADPNEKQSLLESANLLELVTELIHIID